MRINLSWQRITPSRKRLHPFLPRYFYYDPFEDVYFYEKNGTPGRSRLEDNIRDHSFVLGHGDDRFFFGGRFTVTEDGAKRSLHVDETHLTIPASWADRIDIVLDLLNKAVKQYARQEMRVHRAKATILLYRDGIRFSGK